jgi:hypothetical protein
MLLLYTFDTSFHDNDASIALNVVTLGLSPTRKVFVHVAASALLIDTRTGFIYAALEANEKREVRTNAWESRQTADRARQDAERATFKALVGEFEKNWPLVSDSSQKMMYSLCPILGLRKPCSSKDDLLILLVRNSGPQGIAGLGLYCTIASLRA